MFVHLTPEKNVKNIERSGIKATKLMGDISAGVFAMPVTPNFYISHQWLRELKKYGERNIVGVYFRIPDNEEVYISHYNSEHVKKSASEAVGFVLNNEEAEGYEVIIPRKIEAKEIHKIRNLPQVLGWRHFPGSHKSYCGCPVCVMPGTFRAKIKNKKWEDNNN